MTVSLPFPGVGACESINSFYDKSEIEIFRL